MSSFLSRKRSQRWVRDQSLLLKYLFWYVQWQTLISWKLILFRLTPNQFTGGQDKPIFWRQKVSFCKNQKQLCSFHQNTKNDYNLSTHTIILAEEVPPTFLLLEQILSSPFLFPHPAHQPPLWTPQTNPMAQWDPLDISLNPLGPPGPPPSPPWDP